MGTTLSRASGSGWYAPALGCRLKAVTQPSIVPQDGGDFGPFLELDDALINVVHSAETSGSDEVWRVAERVLSPRWEGGESIRCTHVGPRTYLPDADRQGYT